jgi:hypothetical protein
MMNIIFLYIWTCVGMFEIRQKVKMPWYITFFFAYLQSKMTFVINFVENIFKYERLFDKSFKGIPPYFANSSNKHA